MFAGTGAGGAVAFILRRPSRRFMGIILGLSGGLMVLLCLSFAGGTMLFITCGEIIPKSRSIHRGRASAFGIITGIIAGIVLSAI